MKNLENYGVLEMDAKEVKNIEGGFIPILGSSGVSWGNFWKGVGWGVGAGAAGAAAYYA